MSRFTHSQMKFMTKAQLDPEYLRKRLAAMNSELQRHIMHMEMVKWPETQKKNFMAILDRIVRAELEMVAWAKKQTNDAPPPSDLV